MTNQIDIAIGTITFPELQLDKRLIPAFRGAIAGQFRQFDLLHNHTPGGRVLYRYAAVQFKMHGRNPVIYAIGEKAITIFKPLFLEIDRVTLKGIAYPVANKELAVSSVPTGVAESDIVYAFKSPWLALNQENHREYLNRPAAEREELLKGAAVNNIIAFAKFCGYTITERIRVDLKLHPAAASLKGERLTGFMGYLKTNYLLPDNLGLGKSVSRGFGVVERVL